MIRDLLPVAAGVRVWGWSGQKERGLGRGGGEMGGACGGLVPRVEDA